MSIWCAFYSMSNIHRYFGNREWVCPKCPELFSISIHTHLTHIRWWKHKQKIRIRNRNIKGTFICGLLPFKWMSVFQSWLDCFWIGVWAFIQNVDFLSLVVFLYWCPFVTKLKCHNLFSHYTFFKCIKLHQIFSQFSTRNFAQVLDIWIISSLPKILISSTCTRFIVENRDNIWCYKKN